MFLDLFDDNIAARLSQICSANRSREEGTWRDEKETIRALDWSIREEQIFVEWREGEREVCCYNIISQQRNSWNKMKGMRIFFPLEIREDRIKISKRTAMENNALSVDLHVRKTRMYIQRKKQRN